MTQISHAAWWWQWEVIITTISIVMLGVLWYKLTLWTSSRSPRLPPGPISLPVVGYLPFLGRDLHIQLTNLAHTYGPIFKFYLGSKLHVVINTPELAKVVVRDHDETFGNHDLSVAGAVLTFGGQDIAFSKSNENWRKLRKILVYEILSNKSLEACSSIRRDEVRKTIKNVFSKIGTNVNISEIAFWTEANVLRRLVWDDTSYKGENGVYLGAELQMVVTNIVKTLGQPNVSDFFPTLAWFDLQGVERNMKKEVKKLERIFASIMEDRIKSNSEMPHDGVGRKKDFLQVLLDLKDQQDLNTTQVKALLLDVMVAGTETTTATIEWTMANIMRNHEVMKRVQEELVEIVGLNNMVEESHLPKLQYLDATIKETFRMYPVGPILVPRVSSKDCVVGGYMIPEGSAIFLNVYSIHRDPRYWDNPMEFNPNRFLPDEGTNIWDYRGNNLKFFPFGSGRRLCPGVQLAEKMLLFILASLLHSFDWSLPKGVDHDLTESFGLALKKKKPLIAIPYQRLSDASLYI